jgi:murein DD-endopeptidase MepM/ murein hydrolase activator NlpD
MHMGSLAKVGSVVLPGDPLGVVNNTGKSTGPHLHWEVFPVGTDFMKAIGLPQLKPARMNPMNLYFPGVPHAP